MERPATSVPMVTEGSAQLLPDLDPRAKLLKIKPIPIDLTSRRQMGYLRDKIPHKIHQIWVGPKPLPMSFRRWEAYAKKFDYEYKLWTEKEILALPLRNVAQFKSLEAGYPGQADVARYEIIYNYGGYYIDIDLIPQHSDQAVDLADYIAMTNFFLVPENNGREIGTGAAFFANSIFGAAPKNPFLQRIIESLPDNFNALKPPFSNGGAMFMTGPFLLNASLFGSFTSVHRDWIFRDKFDPIDIDDWHPLTNKFRLIDAALNWGEFLPLDCVTTGVGLKAVEGDLLKVKQEHPDQIMLWNQSRRSVQFVDQGLDEVTDDQARSFSTLVPIKLAEKGFEINGARFMGRGNVHAENFIGSEHGLLAHALKQCKEKAGCEGIMYISPRTQYNRNMETEPTIYYLKKGFTFERSDTTDEAAAMIFSVKSECSANHSCNSKTSATSAPTTTE